jgi:hypothetical protein
MTRLRIAMGVLALSQIARAGTSAETRFFDDFARNHYGRGRYAEALSAFLQADQVTPSAASLYNIAVCAELAHEPSLAFAAYEDYLRAGDPDTERRTGAEKRLAAFLPGLAIAAVTSDPPGATIYVDRAELGSFGETPRRVALEPGEHRVTFQRDGFVPVTETVTLVKGKSTEVAVRLEPEKGKLTLDVEPAGATVEVVRAGDHATLPVVSPSVTLPVGSYHVHVTAPNRAPADTDVVVLRGTESRATLVARPLPVAKGRLLVAAGSAPTEVFVDGKRRSVAPAALGLSVGEHDVELRASGLVFSRARVTIREGRTTLLEAARTPEKSP